MADTINQELNQEPVVEPVQQTESAIAQDNSKKKEDKKGKKAKKEKKPRRPFKLVMKTWAKGLGKEASRITWEKKHSVLKDFLIILIICAFFALIFFGLDMIIITIQK